MICGFSWSPGTSRKAVVSATPRAVSKKTWFLATKSVSQARWIMPTLLPPRSEMAMSPSCVSLPETFAAFFSAEAEVEVRR